MGMMRMRTQMMLRSYTAAMRRSVNDRSLTMWRCELLAPQRHIVKRKREKKNIQQATRQREGERERAGVSAFSFSFSFSFAFAFTCAIVFCVFACIHVRSVRIGRDAGGSRRRRIFLVFVLQLDGMGQDGARPRRRAEEEDAEDEGHVAPIGSKAACSDTRQRERIGLQWRGTTCVLRRPRGLLAWGRRQQRRWRQQRRRRRWRRRGLE